MMKNGERGGLIEVLEWMKRFNWGDLDKILILKTSKHSAMGTIWISSGSGMRWRRTGPRNRLVNEWNKLS